MNNRFKLIHVTYHSKQTNSCRLARRNGLVNNMHKHQHRYHNKFSTSTSLPPLTNKNCKGTIHPILSRRYIENHVLKYAKNTKKEKKEEAPWPRGFQIAGYGLAFLSIPFSLCAAIVEIPSFRSLVQGGDEDQIIISNTRQNENDALKMTPGAQLVNALREFWGEEEFISEDERAFLLSQNLPIQKSFENDIPAHIRYGQEEVGKLNRSQQRVSVTLYDYNEECDTLSSSSGSEPTATTLNDVVLDGQIYVGDGKHSNMRKMIIKQLDSSGKDINFSDTNEAPVIAIDFLDESDEENQEIKYNYDNEPLENEIDSNSNSTESKNVSDELRINSQIWSTWQYFPKVSTKDANNINDIGFSKDDIRKSELEWNINALKKQLNDPTCLRDIDEMLTELKASERELRRLKKKWILF